MNSSAIAPVKSTCQFKKENGELCKRSVAPSEKRCWQHAATWRYRWKSLTRNQSLGFALIVLGVICGPPGLYFSYVSWLGTPKPLVTPENVETYIRTWLKDKPSIRVNDASPIMSQTRFSHWDSRMFTTEKAYSFARIGQTTDLSRFHRF
jgi:hypothetical protein